MVRVTNKKKISIKNNFNSLPLQLENTPFLTVKLTRENKIFLNFEESSFLKN